MHLATFNREIHETLDPAVTVEKKNGYFTINYDNGKRFEQKSIYLYRFSRLTYDQWLTEVLEFYADVTAEGY